MVYDPRRENLAHLRRIFAGIFDFTGRSQRSEFLVYLAVAMLIVLILSIAGLAYGPAHWPYSHYIQFALWVPAIPLFVRRLHDQDRSGWFGLILPAILGLKVYEQYMFDSGQLAVPRLDFPLGIVGMGLIIAFWAFVIWPGTDGENRFGPDPRKDLPIKAL